jgi:hypothetical protein
MTLSAMEVSRYGQQSIHYVAFYGHALYVTQLIDLELPRYGDTHIPPYAASYFPASSLGDDFSMYILDHMFAGCIGSVAVNLLVSA